MLKKMKTAVLVLATVFSMGAPALVPAMVSADANIQNNLNCGADLNVENVGGTGCQTDPTSGNSLNNILTLVVNIFSLIVGVVAVIMIIIGGLRYITSGGESGNVSTAKNTIIYAIVGLVVVALAQFIVHFVLAKVNANT
jgi:hypothetical protein